MPRIDDMIACLSRRVMMMLVIVAMIVMVMIMRMAVCMVVMGMIVRDDARHDYAQAVCRRACAAGTPRQLRNKRSSWVVSR